MTTKEAYEQGYNQAKADCLKLLSKWFFFNKEEPRECRKEMQALTPKPPQ